MCLPMILLGGLGLLLAGPVGLLAGLVIAGFLSLAKKRRA